MNNQILKLLNKLTPILQKKVPMFSQTVSQFSKSKTNFLGIAMMSLGGYLLMGNDNSAFGLLLFTNGLGIITMRDTIQSGNKINEEDKQ